MFLPWDAMTRGAGRQKEGRRSSPQFLTPAGIWPAAEDISDSSLQLLQAAPVPAEPRPPEGPASAGA